MLELDLCESKDRIPVVAHDHDLDRVVDPGWMKAHPGCKTVSDCEAKDPTLLPPYAESIRLHFPSPVHGSFYNKAQFQQDRRANEDRGEEDISLHRLCTLQEVLDRTPRNVALHIDVKQTSKSLVKATIQLLASHPRSAPTIILGAGGQQNYVDLQRRLGRSRGFRCGCLRNHDDDNKEKERKRASTGDDTLVHRGRHDDGGTADDEGAADEDDDEIDNYCDEFMCGGCCVCCCCCFSPISPSSSSSSSSSPCCCCGCCCEGNGNVTTPSSSSSSSSSPATAKNEPTPCDDHRSLLLDDPNRRPLVFAGLYHVALVYVLHIFGLLPYVPLNFDVFSIPAPTSSMKELLSRFSPRLASFLTWLLESPALWSYLRSRGIVVFGWVLNSERDFEEASKWPLDGIMTDDVPALIDFYQNKKPNAFMV